jgi:hypothetical protein
MSNPARSVLAAASAAVANRLAVPTAGVPAPDGQPATAPGGLPGADVIEITLDAFAAASEDGRRAARAVRAARKLIDKLPPGLYGPWLVTRESSGRETPDAEEIARIFAANDLGPVPTKPAAPTLKVTRVPAADVAQTAVVDTGEIHGSAA